MKICFACGSNFSSAGWICPSCGKEPQRKHGFYVFAPELADGDKHFDPSFFNELAQLEAGNFWFRARNRLILSAFARYFPDAKKGLEIGCGTGYVISALGEIFPGVKFTGSEIFLEGLLYASRRVPPANLVQMDAEALPYREEFDVVGCFDVLEHIEDDRKVLSEVCRSLKPGGGIILTVPQHRLLWSDNDAESCHIRRYDRVDLGEKLSAAGFRVVWSTSFVTFLLPIMILARVWRKHKRCKASGVLEELRINRFLNWVFEFVMNVERMFIGTGVRFPCGGSLLIVAYKEIR